VADLDADEEDVIIFAGEKTSAYHGFDIFFCSVHKSPDIVLI